MARWQIGCQREGQPNVGLEMESGDGPSFRDSHRILSCFVGTEWGQPLCAPSFFAIDLFLSYVYECSVSTLCVCVLLVLERPEEGTRDPETDNRCCNLPGNRTQVLCWSTKCSHLLNHLSGPPGLFLYNLKLPVCPGSWLPTFISSPYDSHHTFNMISLGTRGDTHTWILETVLGFFQFQVTVVWVTPCSPCSY